MVYQPQDKKLPHSCAFYHRYPPMSWRVCQRQQRDGVSARGWGHAVSESKVAAVYIKHVWCSTCHVAHFHNTGLLLALQKKRGGWGGPGVVVGTATPYTTGPMLPFTGAVIKTKRHNSMQGNTKGSDSSRPPPPPHSPKFLHFFSINLYSFAVFYYATLKQK